MILMSTPGQISLISDWTDLGLYLTWSSTKIISYGLWTIYYLMVIMKSVGPPVYFMLHLHSVRYIEIEIINTIQMKIQ